MPILMRITIGRQVNVKFFFFGKRANTHGFGNVFNGEEVMMAHKELKEDGKTQSSESSKTPDPLAPAQQPSELDARILEHAQACMEEPSCFGDGDRSVHQYEIFEDGENEGSGT